MVGPQGKEERERLIPPAPGGGRVSFFVSPPKCFCRLADLACGMGIIIKLLFFSNHGHGSWY